jgi:hypothetical protein
MGRGASGRSKDIEMGEQRARTDLERASHGEVAMLGVSDQFGGNPKLGLSGE